MSENNTLVSTMRFFKVLMPGFKSELRLPTAFCAKLRGKLSSQAVVTIQIGKWKIKVTKCRGGSFFLQGDYNWDNFVQKHELGVGDFMVFEYHGDMNFSAYVFSPSACEKELAKKMPQEIVGKVDERGISSPSSSLHRHILPPFTRTTITAQSAANNSVIESLMYIPVGIWKPIDLHKKEYAILQVMARGRKEWPVKLRYQKDGESRGWGHGRLAMTKGWLEFAKFNNLKIGDACTFEIIVGELNEDVVKIKVTIIAA